MGVVIPMSKFILAEQSGLTKPLIYCCSYKNIEEQAFSVNLDLAERLMIISPNRRTMQLGKCFAQLISDLPSGAVIKEFDVMFNPVYKVDVLTLLITTYKNKPFDIIWPGSYSDGKLIYAAEGLSDYKTFEVKNYDITCIVQEV